MIQISNYLPWRSVGPLLYVKKSTLPTSWLAGPQRGVDRPGTFICAIANGLLYHPCRPERWRIPSQIRPPGLSSGLAVPTTYQSQPAAAGRGTCHPDTSRIAGCSPAGQPLE